MLVHSAEHIASCAGTVRVVVDARHLAKPEPLRAILAAVDVALLHDCTPTVYQWRPDPVELRAA